MIHCFDRQGRPLEFMDAARLLSNQSNAIVARTEKNSVLVSTVWTGLNLNCDPDGPPFIFETMIFGGEHDGYQDRFTTEAEALAGHRSAVRLAFGEAEP